MTITLQAATTKAVSDAFDEVDKSLSDMTGDNTDSVLENDLDVKIGKFTIEKGDFIDSYKLPVSVKNISSEKASYSITIEAVDENGKRIQDDTVYVNDLNAGQEQDFEAFTLITSDDAKKTEDRKIQYP